MDSAQLIKIKRFNSSEIEAAIRWVRYTGAILISSQPALSKTFWCETIFRIFNYTPQQPLNYQNQTHLHDWNIIMVCQRHNSVLFPITIVFNPLQFSSLLKSISDDGPRGQGMHQDKSLIVRSIIKLLRAFSHYVVYTCINPSVHVNSGTTDAPSTCLSFPHHHYSICDKPLGPLIHNSSPHTRLLISYQTHPQWRFEVLGSGANHLA